MNNEKYLDHITHHRQRFDAHVAVLAASAVASIFGKNIATGGENIPAEGPVILAANHISHADTVLLNSYVYLHHRVPNILVKDGLMKAPVIGTFMRGIHALPVARGQGSGNQPTLDTALRILDRGDAVMIYPEGGTGRGEDFWPARGKMGLGYIALNSDAPVVPIAQWGAQDIMSRGDDGKQHVSLWPLRKPMRYNIGEPMSFARDIEEDGVTEGRKLAPEQIVTDAVMHRITEQLGVIRGEEPQGYYAEKAPDSTTA